MSMPSKRKQPARTRTKPQAEPKAKTKPKPGTGALIVIEHIGKEDWIIKTPRVGEQSLDLLDLGLDCLEEDPAKAAKIFRALYEEHPEDIDAVQHLCLALDALKREDESFELRQRVFRQLRQAFPASFSPRQHRLQWGFIENRPFLRLYLSYGLALLRRGALTEAVGILEDLLSLNPDDNQGARGTLVTCYLGMGQPERALAVCARYPADVLEDVLYGRALALFQTGALRLAAKAGKQAVAQWPLVAIELIKPTHRKPRGANEIRVIMGGPEQAWLYWKRAGDLWARTPGALDFLRKQVFRPIRRKSSAP